TDRGRRRGRAGRSGDAHARSRRIARHARLRRSGRGNRRDGSKLRQGERMKITHVRTHPISTGLDKVYWTSRGAWGSYNMVLVEVETDDGLIGYGQINKTPLKEIAEIVEGLE